MGADIDQAKKMMAGPKKKAETESEIEKEADSALKDPANAKQLQEEAEKAELDMQPGVAVPTPLEFIQESEQGDDDTNLGEADEDAEDDEDDDGFQLMGGSSDDVAKAINARIAQSVSQQLGSSSTDYVDGNALQQFEKVPPSRCPAAQGSSCLDSLAAGQDRGTEVPLHEGEAVCCRQ